MKTLGFIAIVLLQEGDSAPNPVMRSLAFLARHQMPNGAWGETVAGCTCPHEKAPSEVVSDGNVEATAWALLAFMGAGYTELSKQEIGGKEIGTGIKKALDWLIGRQSQAGGFDNVSPAAAALGACIIIEAYSMTAARKQPAERAAAWVAKQSWQDARAIVHQGMAIQSTKLAEFPGDHDARLRELVAALSTQEGTTASHGRLLLDAYVRWKSKDKPALLYDVVPEQLSAEDLNAFAIASIQLDGGERWHKWFEGIVKHLTGLQNRTEKTCELGSWDRSTLRDRIAETAIRCWTLEHYRCWYCKNKMFEQKK